MALIPDADLPPSRRARQRETRRDGLAVAQEGSLGFATCPLSADMGLIFPTLSHGTIIITALSAIICLKAASFLVVLSLEDLLHCGSQPVFEETRGPWSDQLCTGVSTAAVYRRPSEQCHTRVQADRDRSFLFCFPPCPSPAPLPHSCAALAWDWLGSSFRRNRSCV
jgi:hypothetical protein